MKLKVSYCGKTYVWVDTISQQEKVLAILVSRNAGTAIAVPLDALRIIDNSVRTEIRNEWSGYAD